LLGKRQADSFASAQYVKEAKLDLLGMLRIKRKVHTFAVPGCAQRVGTARPDDGLG